MRIVLTRNGPTEDRAEALRRFLVGLARVDEANQLSATIVDLHVRNNTFPGEVFRLLPDLSLPT